MTNSHNNKGITLSKREWLLILFIIGMFVMFGLVVTNTQIGVDLLQTIIAGS